MQQCQLRTIYDPTTISTSPTLKRILRLIGEGVLGSHPNKDCYLMYKI